MLISPQLTQIAYVDALQHLLVGCIFLAVALIALGVAIYAYRKYSKEPDNERWPLSCFISGLVAVTVFALSLLFLCNLWNWVGISHPALLAAKQQIARAHRPRPLL